MGEVLFILPIDLIFINDIIYFEDKMEIIPIPMSLPGIENKVDLVVKHCFYMIATGEWQPETTLPSVRSA